MTESIILHNWKLYQEYNHGDIRQHSFSHRSVSPDAVPPIHVVLYHVATDKPPALNGDKFRSILATIYNQSQLVERKHVACYYLINTAATAVPLSVHPSPLVITTKLAAAILGGGLFGGGVLPPSTAPVPSSNARSTVGIDCPRMKLMLRQSMDSRTVYREESNARWTSSWTSCPQVQWLHETVSVIDWSSIRLIVPGMQPHPVSSVGHNYRYTR